MQLRIGTRRLFLMFIGGIAVGLAAATTALAAEKDLEKALQSRFQRVSLAHLPTPFEPMERLSKALGGPKLYVKRDDQTGLAFGGNKARKLEFIFADIVASKADVVITWAGEQSNWARQTAAAARRFGIEPILVLTKRHEGPVVPSGNLLLDAIMDADVRLIEPGADREAAVAKIAEAQRRSGKNAYVVSVGGSQTGGSMTEPLGAIAYADGFRELFRQAEAQGVRLTHLVTATGSGGTQAGLVVGAKAMASGVEVIGITTGSSDKDGSRTNIANIANQTADALGLDVEFEADEIIVYTNYFGEGYGILNDATVDAITTVARTEGIMLDPVYTGKAMVGLMDLVRTGYFEDDDAVAFLHTGGTPALFVYGDEMLTMMEPKQ